MSDGALVLGVLLGLRHALEPDHLAALSTMVIDARGPLASARLGALWGLGHAASLLLAGGAVVVADSMLPAWAAAACELLVAVMLVALGVRTALGGWQGSGTRGGAGRHRPVLVGLAHGIAGTGALTAIVVAGLPDMRARITYIALFGVASLASMAAASAIAGASVGRLAAGHWRPGVRRGLAIVIGLLALIVGLAWAVAPLHALGVRTGWG